MTNGLAGSMEINTLKEGNRQSKK